MWPTPAIEPLVTIHPFSMESCFAATSFNGGNVGMNTPSSTTWFSANAAVFLPFVLAKKVQFSTMFIVNGTAVSGNVDVGVYAADGTRIVSTGSTAQSGTSAIQLFTVTTTTIGPGLFYLAVAFDNTTATIATWPVGQVLKTKFTGVAQMASAFALPASATLATIGQDSIPFVGLSTRSSI